MRTHGSAALGGQLHTHDFRRHQRYGGVDQNLARQSRGDIFERRLLRAEGHRDDDEIGFGRRLGVAAPRDAPDGRRKLGNERRGASRCTRGIARADDHPLARLDEASRNGRTEFTGAADDGDHGCVIYRVLCGHAVNSNG